MHPRGLRNSTGLSIPGNRDKSLEKGSGWEYLGSFLGYQAKLHHQVKEVNSLVCLSDRCQEKDLSYLQGSDFIMLCETFLFVGLRYNEIGI